MKAGSGVADRCGEEEEEYRRSDDGFVLLSGYFT